MKKQRTAQLLDDLIRHEGNSSLDQWPGIRQQIEATQSMDRVAYGTHTPFSFLNPSLRRGLAVAFIIVISFIASWPVLGDPLLKHVAPREVVTWPFPGALTPGPTPAAVRMIAIEQLEKQAGFSLVLPTYLPSDCTLQERWFASGPKVVFLNYSCVTISLQAAADHTAAPYVGKGATETIMIHGQPALYIGGIWVVITRDGKQQEPFWKEGTTKQLIFEQNGRIVQVESFSPSFPKEELIKIAESLK